MQALKLAFGRDAPVAPLQESPLELLSVEWNSGPILQVSLPESANCPACGAFLSTVAVRTWFMRILLVGTSGYIACSAVG